VLDSMRVKKQSVKPFLTFCHNKLSLFLSDIYQPNFFISLITELGIIVVLPMLSMSLPFSANE
jgi:hypothetical protein